MEIDGNGCVKYFQILYFKIVFYVSRDFKTSQIMKIKLYFCAPRNVGALLSNNLVDKISISNLLDRTENSSINISKTKCWKKRCRQVANVEC